MHGQVKALMQAFDQEWKTIAHAHADEPHQGENAALSDEEKATLDSLPGASLMKYNFFDPEW